MQDLSISANGASYIDVDTVLEDVTEEYFAACHQGLAMGELICTPEFTLRDSVSALEIMHPKMDSGVIDASEELSEPYDCARTLLPDELMAVMDVLLATEVTWHSGSSLPQTLYTCVYVQKLFGKSLAVDGFSDATTGTDFERQLLDRLLFPYVVATMKGADIARDEPLEGYLYMEEDLSIDTSGVDLLPFVQAEAATELLEEGIKWLQLLSQQKTTLIDIATLTQLRKRMRFRLLFLNILKSLKTPEVHPKLVADLRTESENYEMSKTLIDDLPNIFNATIQRILSSTSPPRPTVCMEPAVALSELVRTCQDLVRILPITSDMRNSPSCVLALFNVVRISRPMTLPLVRLQLHSLFLADKMAQHAIEKQVFIVAAIQEVTGPRPDLFNPRLHKVELPRDKRYEISKLVSNLVTAVEPYYLDLFKVLCHNPGRQRRNLCKILTDLDVLQAEAEIVDEHLSRIICEQPKILSNGRTSLSYPISSWILNVKLDICQDILFLGQETDLYKPHEWSMIYWHLDNFLDIQNEMLYSLAVHRVPKDSPTKAHLIQQVMYNEAVSLICKAIWKFTSGLEVLGIIRPPTLKFTSPELLYNHRMLPFSKLMSPSPIPFSTYKENSHHGDRNTAPELLKDANDFFTEARLKLGALGKLGPSKRSANYPILVDHYKSEVKGLLGCCIANNVTISKLLKQDQAWLSSKGRKLVVQQAQFSQRFPNITVV